MFRSCLFALVLLLCTPVFVRADPPAGLPHVVLVHPPLQSSLGVLRLLWSDTDSQWECGSVVLSTDGMNWYLSFGSSTQYAKSSDSGSYGQLFNTTNWILSSTTCAWTTDGLLVSDGDLAFAEPVAGDHTSLAYFLVTYPTVGGILYGLGIGWFFVMAFALYWTCLARWLRPVFRKPA